MKPERDSASPGDRAWPRESAVLPTLHATAVVDPRAQLGEGVVVGPYCVVGPDVVVGRDTVLLSHVVLVGPLVIGERCALHPFAVVGGPAQVRVGAGERAHGSVLLGDDVVVRENVTIHRGTEGRTTTVGSSTLLMVSSHVGHDARVGRSVVVANGVQLAGHAEIEDFVTFGGLAGVAQHVRVGESAFVAAGAMCEADVPPYVIVQGDRARVRALNKVGLSRRSVPPSSVAALELAFRRLFVRRGDTRARVLASFADGVQDPYVSRLVAFVAAPRKVTEIKGK